MFKLEPVIDPQKAEALARRRRIEEERKRRLFDPRARLIGVDVVELQKQLDEKSQLHAKENSRYRAFDEERIKYDQIAVLLEKRLQTDLKEINGNINKFRSQCQKPELRREFDLNDPDALKKQLPARVSDDDPRCTISSIQKFEGEDVNSENRAVLQRKQLHKWLTQQVCGRKEAAKLQKEADDLYITKLVELDRRAFELQEAETACRKAIDIAAQNYNSALTKQKHQERVFEQQREIEDNFTEISNAIFGDILNEKPDDGSGAFGTKRTSTTNWKGFSPQQLADIRRIQKEQILERQMLMEKEAEERLQWDDYVDSATKASIMKELTDKQQLYEKNRKLLSENEKLAEQQKAMKNYLNTEVYVGLVSEEFFKQFNKSSR